MRDKARKRIDFDDIPFVTAIRRGLVMLIPLLMTGSFALILNIIPFPPYQEFITGFAGGFFSKIFVFINQVTFGIFGLCTVVSISACYFRDKQLKDATVMAGVVASLGSFMVYVGLFTADFTLSRLGAVGMFTAIFSALSSSWLFSLMVQRLTFTRRSYTLGASADFNQMAAAILPAGFTVLAAFLFNYLLSGISGVSGFETLFNSLSNQLFDLVGNYSLKTLLFVAVSNFLWFFGIHGTNALEGVARHIFDSAAVGSGTLFLSKNVIDNFVFMGGSGTTICLLVAILLFGRQKNHRSLAKMATLPMLFNVNELLVFGLPIVYNSSFFIPFLATPLVCVLTSWLAIEGLGLVPLPVQDVNWATPIFFNAYQATGSVAGPLLQAFNIAVGALIYRAFLLPYERKTSRRMVRDTQKLVTLLRKSEASNTPVLLLELTGNVGSTAQMLAADLRHVLKSPGACTLELHYQPQYNNHGVCVGAEALLRWPHPQCGVIYPPLVIGLASESGLLPDLEHLVFEMACRDIENLQEAGVCPGRVSVNVTATSLQSIGFYHYLQELSQNHPAVAGVMTIEATEQMSFVMNDETKNHLTHIRNMGILFSVDDFSMGHTSLKYLQSELFEEVKLDGALVKDLLDNQRSVEIISSIVQLARNMNFSVLAEFVETEKQRRMLEDLGVCLYQGWLFSKPLPLPDLIELLREAPSQNKG